MSFLDRIGFKKLKDIRFPGKSLVWLGSPRPNDAQITQDVGDGSAANVVMTPIRWLQRSIIEAPIIVKRKNKIAEDHRLVDLINKPNAFYSGLHLLAATMLSLKIRRKRLLDDSKQ